MYFIRFAENKKQDQKFFAFSYSLYVYPMIDNEEIMESGRNHAEDKFTVREKITMFYIERNDKGQIIALRSDPNTQATEQKNSLDPEILAFLDTATDKDDESWQSVLAMSDLGFIRLLEDLADLLIKKNVILFTELPEKAQEKILSRKRIREHQPANDLVVDDIV